MQEANMNPSECLQIHATRRKEFSQDYSLIFTKPGISFKVREHSKRNNGTIMMGFNDLKSDLAIVLTRQGSFTLSFYVYNMRVDKALKQLRIQIENNHVNYHHIFRVCQEDSTFLFFHESKTDIEIRSVNSMKKRGSIDLIQICKTFDLLESLNQIKVSLDFAVIFHLRKIVLMLASKLILINKSASDQAEVLFDCNELALKERLTVMKYDSKTKTILVSGMTSFFVFGFDEMGLSYSRTLACNRFGRAIRLLGWDPKDEFILIGQRTMENIENYHIVDYRSGNPIFATFMKGQPVVGNHYDFKNQKFFYVEVDSNGKMDIQALSFKGFREKYWMEEQEGNSEIAMEAEYYTSVPPITGFCAYFIIKYFKNMLFLKPIRSIDAKQLKDFALRI